MITSSLGDHFIVGQTIAVNAGNLTLVLHTFRGAPNSSVADVDMKHIFDSPPASLVGSAFLFAASNVAWRFGSGSALAMATSRAALGVLFVTPMLVIASRDRRLSALMRDPIAITAAIFAGLTIPAAATMFRWMPGTQSALVLAIVPAVVAYPALKLSGSHPGKAALPFVALSIVLAAVAAANGGLGDITLHTGVAAAAFLFVELCSLAMGERARKKHDATVIVSVGMVFGFLITSMLLTVTQDAQSFQVSGFAAAGVVAIAGTTARVLRHNALPLTGSTVASTASQITAALTAMGGVIFFRDAIDLGSLLLGLGAASAAVAAIALGKQQINGDL